MSIRVVSVFSGGGGLDLGFIQEGYEVIWAIDNNPNAVATYKHNLHDEIFCADINKIDLTSIPKADVVIGGPPCQSFSLAGNRNVEDERGQLVWRYIEIIKHVQPKAFVFENVTGLLSAKNSKKKSIFELLKQAFRDIGYNVNAKVLNAADYGVPQRRKRVIIVGLKGENVFEFPEATHNESGEGLKRYVSVEEALGDLPKAIQDENGKVMYTCEPKNEYQKRMRKNNKADVTEHFVSRLSELDKYIISYVKPGGNYMDIPSDVKSERIRRLQRDGGHTTCYGRLLPEKPSYTINTYFNRPNVGCNIHYSDDRLISVREALRLQSFPDSFEIVSTSKQGRNLIVGNAVPPMLGGVIARKLKEYISRSEYMIHYSDSEVSVFHPICENALNQAISSLGLASTYRAVHHRYTGSLEMDYVIENVTTGKYLCVIEVKRTPADVNSTRYQMQAMSYVQSNTGMNERTFYFLTNLEYSYAFRYDASRPRPFQQMLLPGLNHIADFSVDDEIIVTNKLAAYFASYLNDFISDTYTYMLTLETFAANMEPLKAMPREWKSHLAIYFYEFIRGSFNYIHRTDLRDVRVFGHDVSKICAEASRVNFKGIYDYSVTSFTPTVTVTNIDLVNLYELGQQNVTGDSIANVLHSIVSSGHEHDGEVATDLELGRIVAALAKDEIGTLAPSDIVCDPAAGSGNLISAAIDSMNLQPTQILANDINTKLIELLTLRIGLNFANIISKTNSPTVSCEDICNLSPSFFSSVKLILMNPPYVAGINCVSRKQLFYQKILSLTGVAPKTEIGQMPLESVFLELITELVAPGTVVACVFPSTQLSAKGKEAIATREMLLDSFGLRTIFMYPDNDIFDAVAKSTCVLIGRVKQPANDVRIISSYTNIPDIDEGMFSHAIKQSLFNGFTSIMPGVDAKKISISDMKASVSDGWKMLNRELEEGQNFINTNFASSTRFSLVRNLTTKLKRGPAGNNGGSDLLFISKNKPLYNKYLPLGLSVASGMCNSKYDSFVVGMGDTQCLDERVNSSTLVNNIIADYISLVSAGGKQQKKVKSALEWLDIVKAESLKSFPAHSVLIPRGTRKDGSIYYADTITFVSTNFFVLPFANQRDAVLSATWMSTVFYQVMVEVNCKNQEGMRKMEKTEIDNTYVPVFSAVSAGTYTDLLAEIGTLEFVNLHHPIVRDVDRIWANELFGANANTMLDEAVRILTYLADVRDPR